MYFPGENIMLMQGSNRGKAKKWNKNILNSPTEQLFGINFPSASDCNTVCQDIPCIYVI